MNDKQEAMYFLNKYFSEPDNHFEFVSELIQLFFPSIDDRVGLFFGVPPEKQGEFLVMLGHQSLIPQENQAVIPLLKRLYADARLSDDMRDYLRWLNDVHRFGLAA